MSTPHLVDPVTVTMFVNGEEVSTTVPAGPLPDGLPVDVVAHLDAAGHLTTPPAKKTPAPKE